MIFDNITHFTETTSTAPVLSRTKEIQDEIRRVKKARSLHVLLLAVVDIVRLETLLILTGVRVCACVVYVCVCVCVWCVCVVCVYVCEHVLCICYYWMSLMLCGSKFYLS